MCLQFPIDFMFNIFQKFKEAMETRKSYIRTMMNSPVILANMYDNEPKMLPSGNLNVSHYIVSYNIKKKF